MLAEVASGLVVEVLSVGGQRSIDSLAGLRERRSKRAYTSLVKTIARNSTTLLSEAVRQLELATEYQENVAAGLRSPEAAILCRHAVTTMLAGTEDLYRAEISAGIVALVGLNSMAPLAAQERLVEVVTTVIWQIAEEVRRRADRDALDKNETLRTYLVAEQEMLANATTSIEGCPPRRYHRIHQFSELYRLQVAARHGYLVPPHLDNATRIELGRIFVPPNLTAADRRGTAVHVDDLARHGSRSVVLGNPGCGKTTLAQRLLHSLATTESARYTVPMLVVLREYNAQLAVRPMSIAEFLAQQAAERYQVRVTVDDLEYILATGRAFLVFDGLDELLDTSQRREVADNVESFCARFQLCRAVVTSREVGYFQAPLSQDRFATYRLAEFSDTQVGQYAEAWFGLDETLSAAEHQQLVEAFLRESESVLDLRTNPLMLGLLCNLYRGAGFIPASRAEVYRSCALLLFERWDQRRQIRYDLPYRSYLDPAVKYLAYWIYSDVSLQTGVPEADLIRKLTEYLSSGRIPYPEQAAATAEAFIGHCRGRAWVLTDTGTTPDGTRLYQFTHRTFLEYFTAAQLVRLHPTGFSLWRTLQSKLEAQEWDLVAQLAVQLLAVQREGAADEFLACVLRRVDALTGSTRSGWRRDNLLAFAVRMLGSVIANSTTRQRVCDQAMQYLLALRPERRANWAPLSDPRSEPILDGLRSVTNDNAPEVVDAVSAALEQALSDTDALVRRRAGLCLVCLSRGLGGGRPSPWQRVAERVFTAEPDLGMETALARNADGRLPIDKVVVDQGLPALWRTRLEESSKPEAPSIARLGIQVVWGRTPPDWPDLAARLAPLFAGQPPYFQRRHLTGLEVDPELRVASPGGLSAYTYPDAGVMTVPFFVACVLFCAYLEVISPTEIRAEHGTTRWSWAELPVGAHLGLARFVTAQAAHAQRRLDATGLGSRERLLLRDWLIRRVNFVHDDGETSA